MNDELEGTWKQVVVVYVEVQSRNFSARSVKNHGRHRSG
jgi:hypothetical protein